MTRVLTSRRWQLAFWGTNLLGSVCFWGCVGHTGSFGWQVAAWTIAYLTGFLAAVLVEIGTQ
jgi:hypothetical protein